MRAYSLTLSKIFGNSPCSKFPMKFWKQSFVFLILLSNDEISFFFFFNLFSFKAVGVLRPSHLICVPQESGNIKAHSLLKVIIFSASDWQDLTIIWLTVFQYISWSVHPLYYSGRAPRRYLAISLFTKFFIQNPSWAFQYGSNKLLVGLECWP